MVVGVKLKQPQEGVMGAVPEHLQSSEERYWLEQAAIDDWIAKLEAGEMPPSTPITGEWSTVQEVATRHRCSVKTIRARIHDGTLKAVNHAPKGSAPRQARWRIHRDVEEAWIRAKGENRRATTARKAQTRRTFKDLIA